MSHVLFPQDLVAVVTTELNKLASVDHGALTALYGRIEAQIEGLATAACSASEKRTVRMSYRGCRVDADVGLCTTEIRLRAALYCKGRSIGRGLTAPRTTVVAPFLS